MVDHALARSFESIGEDYDLYRPGFPSAAAEIIVPEVVGRALDLGAGTGKFTRLLLRRADRVIAVEPSVPMLTVLRANLPSVEAVAGTAENISVEEASVDVVTVAQAFHWFDREPACAEIARVLVPGGALGLIWNRANPACAWDMACQRIAHPAVDATDATVESAAEELPGFEFVRHDEVAWTEWISREHYVQRWSTVSSFLAADQPRRSAMRAAIDDVLDTSPETRGRTDFELDHVTEVFVYRRV
ncbi:class I SAM-dependent methyltransferase [Microbacterium sp. W4I20]|uniref:class I SAM-dependent methyltransferase n=1 Tax=Microbacterium sp. W4I20 TaxID=3042262 RepID=UPI00277E855F|nr:class I SAM-dependent methyltransferase [Microbacterium sp. W4I20]MDQ0725597.1 ubiquinone/menaquinone biosynthesis C-methylase UbiE [Microbacterium sp. W4I20]